MFATVKGTILKKDTRVIEKTGEVRPYCDVYIPDDGSTIRIDGFSTDVKQFDTVTVPVRIFNGSRDLYIKVAE